MWSWHRDDLLSDGLMSKLAENRLRARRRRSLRGGAAFLENLFPVMPVGSDAQSSNFEIANPKEITKFAFGRPSAWNCSDRDPGQGFHGRRVRRSGVRGAAQEYLHRCRELRTPGRHLLLRVDEYRATGNERVRPSVDGGH